MGSGASSWCKRTKRSNQQSLRPHQLDPREPDRGEFTRDLWRQVCVSFLSSRGWCLLQPRGEQSGGSQVSYLPSMTSRSFLPLVVPESLFMGWLPPSVCLTEGGCRHLYLVESTCEAHPSTPLLLTFLSRCGGCALPVQESLSRTFP